MARRISEEAVNKSTGKTWDDWFAILNKTGAKNMEHKDTAKLLSETYKLSPWWSQMVTVQYEQDIKGRKKHETITGYQISKSLTLRFPAAKIYNAVKSPSQRKVWMKDPDITVTRSVKNKSIRGKWIDGKTNLEIQLFPKSNSKVQLAIQHNKISSANEAERMKNYWKNQLKSLKKFLEKK